MASLDSHREGKDLGRAEHGTTATRRQRVVIAGREVNDHVATIAVDEMEGVGSAAFDFAHVERTARSQPFDHPTTEGPRRARHEYDLVSLTNDVVIGDRIVMGEVDRHRARRYSDAPRWGGAPRLPDVNADHPDAFGGSDDEPNPFAGLPIFGDIMKMFGSQGPVQWDTARQIALVSATGGASEPNPDPAARVAFVELSRIVARQVQVATGREDASLDREPEVVTRTVWTQRTLDDYRPLFNDLATSLAARPTETDESDPFASMFSSLTGMLAPMMMGMTVGSMVGLLARRALGQYDLPIPRKSSSMPMFIISNIDGFADEWSLPRDDVRMWTLINELSMHAVISLPHVTDRLDSLIRRHAAAFRPNPSALTEKLSSLDLENPMDAMQSLQSVLGDPAVLLGAVRSPEQDELQPTLDTIVSLVLGWADHLADQVGTRILGNPARLAEAARRRRVEAGDETAFVEKLLGLRIDRPRVEKGRQFVEGVIERASNDGLAPLYENSESLPTMSELDAPGLWLARLDISGA